jgi:hypothetical protein
MLSKPKQTTDISRAHAALLAEATRLGWPTHFVTDLDHDARAIATMAPHEPFAWAIGAHGTHIGRSGGQLTMRMVSDNFNDCRFFVWDGCRMHEAKNASDADSQLASFTRRRYQIRCARCTASFIPYSAASATEAREIASHAETKLGESFVVRDTWEGK